MPPGKPIAVPTIAELTEDGFWLVLDDRRIFVDFREFPWFRGRSREELQNVERAISADTALRFARFFGISGRFWLNLQTRYDLEVERDRLGARLDDEVTPLAEVRAG